jgi:hypothetical protein
MRGDVRDGAEDPLLLELDVLRNRLEDVLAFAKMLWGQHPTCLTRISVTGVASCRSRMSQESPMYSIGSSLTLKLHRFRFFNGAIRVGGN